MAVEVALLCFFLLSDLCFRQLTKDRQCVEGEQQENCFNNIEWLMDVMLQYTYISSSSEKFSLHESCLSFCFS